MVFIILVLGDKKVEIDELVLLLFSSFFMNTFEKNHPLLSHIVYWHRYVDDVLCLWSGTTDDATDLISFLNSLYASINFTLEIGGSTINVLDLTISINNGQLEGGGRQINSRMNQFQEKGLCFQGMIRGEYLSTKETEMIPKRSWWKYATKPYSGVITIP